MSCLERKCVNPDWKSYVHGLYSPIYSNAVSMIPYVQDNRLVKATGYYCISPVWNKLIPAAARSAQFSFELIGSNLNRIVGVQYLTYSCAVGLGKFSHLAKVENLYIWRFLSVGKFEFAQRFNIVKPAYSHYLNLHDLRFLNYLAIEKMNYSVAWNVQTPNLEIEKSSNDVKKIKKPSKKQSKCEEADDYDHFE